MAQITHNAEARQIVASVGSEKEYRKAQALVAKPLTKMTPALAAKLRKARAYIEIFEQGSRASQAAILTLAGPPLTFHAHTMRMEASFQDNCANHGIEDLYRVA